MSFEQDSSVARKPAALDHAEDRRFRFEKPETLLVVFRVPPSGSAAPNVHPLPMNRFGYNRRTESWFH